MKFINCKQNPIKVCGLPYFYETGEFWRLPEGVISQMPSLEELGKRSVGGRVIFRTNSENILVKMRLKTLNVDICIPITGSSGMDVYVGERKNAMYVGHVSPLNYDESSKIVESK